MTKEQFLSGESRPVNPELMHAFMSCGLVEQSGHGVPVVAQKYGEEAYKLDGGFVKVTIPFYKRGYMLVNLKRGNFSFDNLVEEKQIDIDNERINATINATIKLSKTEIEVYKIIKSNTHITIPEIVKITGKHKATISRAISVLKENKIIERVGSNKTGCWNILA